MPASLSFAELLAQRTADLRTELASAHDAEVQNLQARLARAQACAQVGRPASPEAWSESPPWGSAASVVEDPPPPDAVAPPRTPSPRVHCLRPNAAVEAHVEVAAPKVEPPLFLLGAPDDQEHKVEKTVSPDAVTTMHITGVTNVVYPLQPTRRTSKLVLAARSVMAARISLDHGLSPVVPSVPDSLPPALPIAERDDTSPKQRVQLALPGMPPQPVQNRAAEKCGTGTSNNSDTVRRHSILFDAVGAGARDAARRPSMRGGLDIASRVTFSRKHDPIEPWPAWAELAEEDDSSTASSQQEKKISEMRKSAASERLRLHSKSRDFHKIDRSSVLMTKLQALVIHPSSPRRLAWILAGVLLITFDVITVPLYAFSLPSAFSYLSIIVIIGCLYWTSDFMVSFLVGFNYPGTLELELRPKVTAWKYVSTWAFVDVALLILEWYVILIDVTNGQEKQTVSAARATRSMRMLRTLRTVRLVRCAKVPGILKEVAVLLGRSETTGLLGGISKHFGVILLINHLIACLWFAIGRAMGPEGWVAYYVTNDIDLLNDWRYQYLTSLHWSLTQFTPATMAVQPQNLAERFFAVVVLLFAMITFSSFVSSLTNMMTHLRMLKSVESKQFAKLERYLHDNKISFHLTLRVRRYLEHSIAHQKHKPSEADVEMLARLSEPLRMELHYEVYSPCLTKHPFFQHYSSMNLLAMQRLCHTALKTMNLSTDDVLFSRGEAAKCMYFVLNGCFEYMQTINFKQRTSEVLAGHWACEMCLWAPWEHRGQMRATTGASLVALDCGAFHTGVFESREGQTEAASYACQAVQTVNDFSDPSAFSDLDTSWFNPTVICSQVFKTPSQEGGSEVKPTLKFGWTKNLGGALRHSLTNNSLGDIRTSQNSTSSSVMSIPEGETTP